MNSGQGVNYEVSGCVLITAESGAVPVYQSLAGIVFCFRIITSRADTPRRFVLGKSSSHMTIPLRQGSSRRVFVSGVFVSLCAEPRRGQLVLVIRRVWVLPIKCGTYSIGTAGTALRVSSGTTPAPPRSGSGRPVPGQTCTCVMSRPGMTCHDTLVGAEPPT